MGIDCDRAFERLLEADPAELAPSGEGELSDHLRECGRCREVADRLLEGQLALDRSLSEMAPRLGAEEALIRARATARRRSRRGQVRRWAAPLAAAAVLAGLLITRGPGPQESTRESGPSPLVRAEPLPVVPMEPLVEAPADRNVMVFETGDRSAKVIWFY